MRLLAGIAVALALVTRGVSDSAHAAKAPHVDLAIAQKAAGAGNGAGCANARAVAFLNAASNWGEGRPIAPGTVVALCGTITSTLFFQGSGSSGNPITLYFEPNAKISMPTCACIDTTTAAGGPSWITIDGGTNGVIEATDSCQAGCGHPSANRAIDMQGCNHCTVENLTMRNGFVMPAGGTSGAPKIDGSQSNAIYAEGTDFTAKNNTIHDFGWEIYDNNGTNSLIEGNNLYNMDHGIILSGGGTGNVVIASNHIHDMGNWDCGGGCHHDGIHCYTVRGGSPNNYTNGIYIYDNRFDGTVGSDNTSWIFLESNTGSGATPCADSTSPVYVFNNWLTETDHAMNNGIMTPASGQVFTYNNTIVGLSNGNKGGYSFDCCAGNTGVGKFENNVMSTVNNFGGWLTADFSTIDYDVYGDAHGLGTLRWTCNHTQTNAFATFQGSCGEAHGSYTTGTLRLNSSGVPQARSPVLNAGTNLSSLCTGNLAPLCRDIDGNLRPVRMAPDAGAFQRETALLGMRSLGKIRIGDSQADVERFYGRRSPRATKAPLLGAFRIQGTATAVYRLHGGIVDVSYRSGKVVAVTTTSHYYSTVGGFGVGATADRSALIGAGWKPCGRAIAARHGGVVTAATVEGSTIRALTVARADALVCAP